MTISTMNPEQVQLLNLYNIVAQIRDSVTGALTILTLDLKSIRKNHHGFKNITSQLMCKTQKSITFLATITLDPKSWRNNFLSLYYKSPVPYAWVSSDCQLTFPITFLAFSKLTERKINGSVWEINLHIKRFWTKSEIIAHLVICSEAIAEHYKFWLLPT